MTISPFLILSLGLSFSVSLFQVHVSKEDLCKLLLHSIPKDTTNEHIMALFQRVPTGPQPVQLEGNAVDKKLTAVFKHAGDANDAFKLLEGQASKDSAGRAFKEVGTKTFARGFYKCASLAFLCKHNSGLHVTVWDELYKERH